MKYRCKICGFVYDDTKEKTPFEDLPDSWVCPICNAPKSMFERIEDNNKKENQNKPITENDKKTQVNSQNSSLSDDFKLSISELSILCTNLARGCEKQYKYEEMELFKQLAEYFDNISPAEKSNNVEELAKLINSDLEKGFPEINLEANKVSDRGALRVKTWSEKVTNMLNSLLLQYKSVGEKMLENTSVWVCSVCGFVYIGKTPPEMCPVCKVPSWKFEKVEGRKNG